MVGSNRRIHSALNSVTINVIIINAPQYLCVGQHYDDRPVRREGSRCGTASPCESLISFTSLIDSRPSSGDYTSKGKG